MPTFPEELTSGGWPKRFQSQRIEAFIHSSRNGWKLSFSLPFLNLFGEVVVIIEKLQPFIQVAP
jgi:hypothetical protein